MKVLGVDVAYLHTSHGREMADWFVTALGLELAYHDEHWFSFVAEEGSGFGLDVTGHPRSVVEAQPIMLSWRVDDIEAAVEAFSDRGVRFYPSVEETIFDVGPKLVATFEDPDGNWHQLSQVK